jgi:hypothetical protein
MDKQTLSRISDHHIRTRDKFYRMYAGLSSDIDDYADSTIYITIRKNTIWPKDDETTAKQIAGDWRTNSEVLRGAKKYHVSIINSDAPTGFVFNHNASDDSATVKAAIEALKNIPSMDDLKKESGVVVITGYFDDHGDK